MENVKQYLSENSQASEEIQASCVESLQRIRHFFSIQDAVKPDLSGFYSIVSKQHPVHFTTWTIGNNRNNFDLCLIEYELSYYSGGHRTLGVKTEAHLYFFGLLRLKRDYGTALIRPETLRDKINEWGNPVELDIPEHPQFSRKYYVLAKEKEHFANHLSPELLDFIEQTNELQLEFNGNRCLFRLPSAVQEESSLELCSIGLRLAELLG